MLRNRGYAFFLDAMLAIALFVLILNFISIEQTTPQKFKFLLLRENLDKGFDFLNANLLSTSNPSALESYINSILPNNISYKAKVEEFSNRASLLNTYYFGDTNEDLNYKAYVVSQTIKISYFDSNNDVNRFYRITYWGWYE